MEERSYYAACSKERCDAEWSDLPASLREALESSRGDDVAGYPAFKYEDVIVDIALIRSVYEDGGMSKAIKFLVSEALAVGESMAFNKHG